MRWCTRGLSDLKVDLSVKLGATLKCVCAVLAFFPHGKPRTSRPGLSTGFAASMPLGFPSDGMVTRCLILYQVAQAM